MSLEHSLQDSLFALERKKQRDKGGACISLPWPPCCHPQSFPHTAAMVNQENRRQIKSLCSKPTPHFTRVKVEVLPKVYKPLYNVPPAQPPDLTFYSPSHRSLHSSHTTSLLFLLSPLPRTPFPQMAAWPLPTELYSNTTFFSDYLNYSIKNCQRSHHSWPFLA